MWMSVCTIDLKQNKQVSRKQNEYYTEIRHNRV